MNPGPRAPLLADVYYVCICVKVRIMQREAFRGFQSTFFLAQKYMNRSLTSFSESKKHTSLSYAFKHPFICAHLPSVTIFWELCAYISEQNGGFYFCLDYFLLHIPEQLLMWQESTDISMDLDNLWLWKLFKMFLNYFLFLYCLLYNPFLYTWESVEAFMFHPQYERSSNEQCSFWGRNGSYCSFCSNPKCRCMITARICVWFSACMFLMF